MCRIHIITLLFLLNCSAFVFAQNVGVGTANPLEKLHVAGTLRVDDLQTAQGATVAADKMVWVDAAGKVYAFPAGIAGKILGVNGSGVLAWLDPGMNNTLNNGQIWIGDVANTAQPQTMSGDAVISNTGVITIQNDAVDGTDITISGETPGSLMYFNGTDWVNLGIGTPGQILTSVAGVPTWVSLPAAPVMGDLTTATSGVTVTGGTGAVIGAGTMVDVATNGLNQNGLVTGPTLANANQVWGTNGAGVPGWMAPISNDWQLLGNGGTSPATNFIGTTDPVDFVIRTNNTEKMRVVSGGNVGIGNAAPTAKLDVASANGWDVVNTAGDFRVGNGTNDFRLGVAQGGAGTGDVYMNSRNGTQRIFIGGGTNATLVTVDGSNNRVGLSIPGGNGTASKLDINGDLALREGTAIAVVAGSNAITMPAAEFSHYRLTGAGGAFSLNTITGGNDGQVLTLINATGQNMTINNNNAANGILTGSGANLSSAGTGNSSVTLIYNNTLARWIVKSSSGMADANNWRLTGNAGTSPATNFIGTTDNQPLLFRTNNTLAAKINNSFHATLGVGLPYSNAGVLNGVNGYSVLEAYGDGLSAGDITFCSAGNNIFPNYLIHAKARGTQAGPAVVAQGDLLGMHEFWGYDGAAYRVGASIAAAVDAAPGLNDLPTSMIFSTITDGSAGAAGFYPNISERMRITNAGIVSVNNNLPTATDRFQVVSGTAMNGVRLTSQRTTAGSYGLLNNATFTGGTANVYTGYNGTITIAGGTSTNAGVYSDITNGSTPSGVFSTTGTNTSSALIGTSSVWNGGNMRSSLANAIALVGVNTALAGVSTGNGVYGLTSQRDGVGIYGMNNGPAGTSFGWGYGTSRASVYGDGITTGSYSFGVMGDGGSSTRSGGVFGDDFGVARGALGYFAANLIDYGVYGFGAAYQTGLATGRVAGEDELQTASMENAPNNMVGLGIYGGVMGGWVRGIHYGLHAKGSQYGMYVDGNSVTNTPAIQLIAVGKENRVLSFAPSSMSADVYTRGTARVVNGSAFVAFTEDFSLSISEEIPLNITVTPTGNSKGVYVTDITNKGFRIVENENGSSNIAVNWVAYGTRTGYENPAEILSPEILSGNFDKNMEAVMYNDNNTDGTAKGIWFDGEKVQTGQTPESFYTAKHAKVRTRQHPNADNVNPNPPKNLTKVNGEQTPQVIGVSDIPLEVQNKSSVKRGNLEANDSPIDNKKK